LGAREARKIQEQMARLLQDRDLRVETEKWKMKNMAKLLLANAREQNKEQIDSIEQQLQKQREQFEAFRRAADDALTEQEAVKQELQRQISERENAFLLERQAREQIEQRQAAEFATHTEQLQVQREALLRSEERLREESERAVTAAERAQRAEERAAYLQRQDAAKLAMINAALARYGTDVNDDCICPIIWAPFTDPVICADGHMYERSAIVEWFQRGNDTSPVTNIPLPNRSFRPARLASAAIAFRDLLTTLQEEKDPLDVHE